MSILKSKHNGWLADGTRTPFTGGGGGGPSQTTTQTSNIPEYARPYVENMLGATQAQLFQTNNVGGLDNEGNPTSRTEITGFKPYQAYSSNVNDYFAGPSDLMKQSYQGMANMRVAPQIGEGSVMANQGGAGLMGTVQPAGAYGQMGAGLGLAASGAGQNYENQATNASDVARYMSPYMQNVVDYQKGQALRDFQMGQPMMAAKAVGQGAFGGNRLALQQSEAQRGLMSQLQGIEATGSQKAFDTAQQAQQYRANLGLQGMQAGMQGAGIGLQGVGAQQAGYSGALNAANTLGNLGQNQYGQQMGILEGQNRFGLQQQQMEQAKINQGISDYATAQQYPMLQLGMMSNMLRGLPMQSQTTQMYQAAPSYLQQGIGGIGALGSLYGSGALGKKEGGVIGYRYGGAISGPKLESMADKLTPVQLQAKLKDRELDKGERQIFEDAFNDKAKDKARYSGIAAAGGGLFESQGYAGGGILAFADTKPDDETAMPIKEKKKNSAFQQDLVDMFGYSGTKDTRPEVPEWMTKTKNYFTKPRESTTPTPDQLNALAASKGVYPEGSPALSEGTTIAAGPTQAQRDAFYEKAPGSRAPSGNTGATAAQPTDLAGLLKERQALGPQGVAGADFEEFLKGRLGGSEKRLSQAQGLAAAKAFAKFGSTYAPGGMGQAGVAALGDYAEGYGKATAAEDTITLETQKMRKDLEIARRAEERGDVEGAQKAYDNAANRQNEIKRAQIAAAATMAGHGATQKTQDIAIDKIMKEKGVGYTEALQIYKRAGLNVENTEVTRAKAALAQLNEELMMLKKDDPRRATLMQQRDQLTQALISGGGTQVGGVPKDIQGILSKYQQG
jgi:hypothetical protein